MILTRLGVENFCQHKHLDISFPSSGVIIIQGANGSGKSNLIRAIQFALSGTVSNTPTKDLNIGWGAATGSVTLDFVINGLDGSVTRQLGASKAKLAYGEELANSVSAVNKQMESLLGNLKIFEKFVIVQQGKLTELIDIAPAERMKLLHILFKTDKYERIFNAVNAEYNNYLSIQIPIDKPEQIQQKLTELNDYIKTRQASIDSFQSQFKYFDAAKVTTELSINSGIRNRVKDTPALRTRFQDLNLKIEMEEQHLKTLTNTYTAYKITLDGLEQKAIEAKVGLSNYERVVKQEQLRVSLLKEFDSCSDSLNLLNQTEMPKLDYPDNYESDIQTQTIQLSSDLATSRHFFSSFANGTCPTCGTTAIHLLDGTTKDIKADVELHRRNYDRIQAELQLKEHMLATFRSDRNVYHLKLRKFEEQSNACIKAMESVQTRLASLPPQETAADASSLNHIIQQYEYAKSQFTGISTDVTNTTRAIDRLRTELTHTELQLNELMAEATKIEAYDFEGTATDLRNWNAAQLEIGVAQADIRNANNSIAEWTKKLTEVTNLIDRANRQTLYKDMLTKVKNTLHRDNLPTAFAKAYFSVLNTEWNNALTALDVPFGVELDANLDIHITFPENRALISQLSGGQQCCLALGFLLAVKKYFTPSTNFMILDEPTYGLDDSHINRLIEILLSLNDYASSNNMQIFVVTHSRQIMDSFSQHIIIGK